MLKFSASQLLLSGSTMSEITDSAARIDSKHLLQITDCECGRLAAHEALKTQTSLPMEFKFQTKVF